MRKDFLITNVRTLLIIAPEKFFLKKIIDALNLIKKTDPREYENLFSRISCIFVTYMNDYTNSFFPAVKIWFVNKTAVKKNNLIRLASTILHEGFHTTQFKNENWTSSQEVREKAANEFQIKFLRKLGDQKWIVYLRREVKRKYWLEANKCIIGKTYHENLLELFKTDEFKFTYIEKNKLK